MRNKLIELICEGTQKTEICTTETYMDCEPCRGDCGYCAILSDHLIANGVTIQKWIPVEERLTNADRIRAMNDEELAEWLVKKTTYQVSAWSEPSYLNFLTKSDDTIESAINGTIAWLQAPAEEA